jgi:hypothetical protein
VAGDGLIAAYLVELRHSVARLPDADDIGAEAEDHLLETVDRLCADGRSPHEAEAEAVARFGSAELVARICITESKRGAAVPTTKTRYAGLALLAAPILALVGEIGNETTGHKGGLHGFMVFVLCMAVPALFIGLWGLRRRNGGLGQLGLAALILAFLSPVLAMAAGWGAFVAFAALMALAICVLAVEMIRAQILPVVPLVLLAVGTVAVLVVTGLALLTESSGDVGLALTAIAAAPLVVGIMWLGWFMWREPAVDRAGAAPLATT